MLNMIRPRFFPSVFTDEPKHGSLFVRIRIATDQDLHCELNSRFRENPFPNKTTLGKFLRHHEIEIAVEHR